MFLFLCLFFPLCYECDGLLFLWTLYNLQWDNKVGREGAASVSVFDSEANHHVSELKLC